MRRQTTESKSKDEDDGDDDDDDDPDSTAPNEITTKTTTTTTPKSQKLSFKKKKKARFDGLDVTAMTAHVHRTLLRHRVVNVYDGFDLGSEGNGNGCYLIKLADTHSSSNRVNDENKEEEGSGSVNGRAMLLLESGIRFHATSYQSSSSSSSTNQMPSPFAMKLRKHIRNLRLENIVQLGDLDRVVDLRFGSGDSCHHLILEMYARGNLLLTDGEYRILALLRTHEYHDGDDGGGGEEEVKVRVGNVYPVTYATTLSVGGAGRDDGNDDDDDDGCEEKKKENESLENSNETQVSDNGDKKLSSLYRWAKSELQSFKSKSDEPQQQPVGEKNKKGANKKGGGGKKKKRKGGDGFIPLRALLLKPSSGVSHYGPSLIEHCILAAEMDPNLRLNFDTIDSVMPIGSWSKLSTTIHTEGPRIVNELRSGRCGGYVLYHPKTMTSPTPTSNNAPLPPHSDKILYEFQPHLLHQHTLADQHQHHIHHPTFSQSVDLYFSLLSTQRQTLRIESLTQAAHSRLEKVKLDQRRRQELLAEEMESLKKEARLVELNAEGVDRALSVIREGVERGMDWEDLERLVDVERRNGNCVALLIRRLDLEGGRMILGLKEEVDDEEEEETEVTVSLSLTAHGNARDMYDQYRASKSKAQKTLDASAKALRAAEQLTQKQLAQHASTSSSSSSPFHSFPPTLQPKRRPHWFEKFHWCITSSNYLVLAGRDAQQNELLVKRYLRPGDAYLHADVHGASSCILRAKRRRRAEDGKTEVLKLEERALVEAGNFTICLSSAWGSKMVTSAWWVESHQVSKTAPTGEYLTVGSFMIRGKKNFLPASHLEMGLGVLFRLGDDESIARHANERRDFALLERENSEATEREVVRQDSAVSTPDEEVLPETTESPEVPETPLRAEDQSPTAGNENKNKETNHSFTKPEHSPPDPVINDDPVDTPQQNPVVDPPQPDDVEQQSTESENKAQDNDTSSPSPKKKGLSVRDRKLLKRYGSLSPEEMASAKLKTVNDVPKKKKKSNSILNQAPTTTAPKNPSTRGKKSKQKKAAKKYADQDDEDRELAMLALQGGGGDKQRRKKNKKNKKGKNNVNSDVGAVSNSNKNKSVIQQKVAEETKALLIRDSSIMAEKLPIDVRKVLALCLGATVDDNETKEEQDDHDDDHKIRWNKFDADILEQLLELDSEDDMLAVSNRLLHLVRSTQGGVDNFSASLSGIIHAGKRYGFQGLGSKTDADKTDGNVDSSQNEEKAEKEAWREVLAEDGIIESTPNDDVAIDDTAELSKLTGKPLPDDVLQYAVPVCAPYQTLAQYKYRVKLTPGSLKRGKASKQCVEIFMRSDNSKSGGGVSAVANRNRDLIKKVGDHEWVQVLCGDVKITGPGVSKVAKAHKAGNKRKGKKKK